MMERQRRKPNKNKEPNWEGRDRKTGKFTGEVPGPGRTKGSINKEFLRGSRQLNEYIEGAKRTIREGLGGKKNKTAWDAIIAWMGEDKRNEVFVVRKFFEIIVKQGVPEAMLPELLEMRREELEIRRLEAQRDIGGGAQQINIQANMPIPNISHLPTRKIEADVVEPKMIESKMEDVIDVQPSDAVVVESKDEEGWEDF